MNLFYTLNVFIEGQSMCVNHKTLRVMDLVFSQDMSWTQVLKIVSYNIWKVDNGVNDNAVCQLWVYILKSALIIGSVSWLCFCGRYWYIDYEEMLQKCIQLDYFTQLSCTKLLEKRKYWTVCCGEMWLSQDTAYTWRDVHYYKVYNIVVVYFPELIFFFLWRTKRARAWTWRTWLQ